MTAQDDFLILAEALPHLVWIAAPGGEVTYVNQRWRDYTGITEEPLREAAIGVCHPDDRPRMQRAWNEARTSGKPYEVEYRLRNAVDGSYRWFLTRAIPIRGEDGTLERWVGTATDIDVQRRTTDNLRFVLDCSGELAKLSDMQTVCDRLVEIAIERFADWCMVAIGEGSGRYTVPSIAHRDPELVRSVAAYRDRSPMRSGANIARVIETGEPILLPAVDEAMIAAAAHDEEHLELLHSLHVKFAMAVPISNGGGKPLGALALFSSESARRFDATDVSVAQTVARQAAIAIANAGALENERRIAAMLRFLANATQRLGETFDVGRAMASVLDLATQEVVDVAYVWNVEGEAVRLVATASREREWVAQFERLTGERPMRPEGEAILLERFRKGEPYVIDAWPAALMREHFYEYAFEAFRSLKIGSLLSLPLKMHGEPAGALVFVRRAGSPPFTETERETLADLARHVMLAYAQSELFARERRISSELQRAMLPRSDTLPNAPGLAFDVTYHPSASGAEVGGDWYDAFQLPDGSLVISVGDVSGRGLGAAGLMGKLRQAIGVIALYERDPARMLDAADAILRQRGWTQFATAFIGVIDPQRRTIRYANAGHPYPLLRREHDIVELESHGLPLGLRDHVRSESVTMPLGGARMLVLYTDGLVEATHDLSAGEERLRSVLRRDAIMYVKSPAKMLIEAILPQGAPDDAAVLTVCFAGHPRWGFDADNARAAHDARADFIAYLRNQGGAGDIAAAEVIFGELIGNVVRHAPGPIEVQLEWSGPEPVLHVTDRGGGFDRAPSLPDDVMKESGRGLFIVESLSRHMSVEFIAGYGTHIAAGLPVRREISRVEIS